MGGWDGSQIPPPTVPMEVLGRKFGGPSSKDSTTLEQVKEEII